MARALVSKTKGCEFEACHPSQSKEDEIEYSWYIQERTYNEMQSKRFQILLKLLKLQQEVCYYCGCKIYIEHEFPRATLDHHYPLSKGGKDEIDNCVASCYDCNNQKGDTILGNLYDENGILGFFGEYRFLSNFHPCEISYGGRIYPSTENAYQAAKCENDEDRDLFVDVTPGKSKRIGRGIKLRSDWEYVKVKVMRELLGIKFSIPELSDLLLATNDLYLEETNYWNDTFWGVCNGVGTNVLGNLLMEIRNKLNAL